MTILGSTVAIIWKMTILKTKLKKIKMVEASKNPLYRKPKSEYNLPI